MVQARRPEERETRLASHLDACPASAPVRTGPPPPFRPCQNHHPLSRAQIYGRWDRTQFASVIRQDAGTSALRVGIMNSVMRCYLYVAMRSAPLVELQSNCVTFDFYLLYIMTTRSVIQNRINILLGLSECHTRKFRRL